MGTLERRVLELCPDADSVWVEAVRDAMAGIRPVDSMERWADVRSGHGFKRKYVELHTLPSYNDKLEKGAVPSYGITLQHTVTRLGGLVVNACPWSTPACRKVCVLNNGNGAYPEVQRARIAKTDLLSRHPRDFIRCIAWEQVKYVRKHGAIVDRLNVNADIGWHRIIPSMFDGVTLPGLSGYDYTKDPAILDHPDGWVAPNYRIAYSWNERSDPDRVGAFYRRGGAVAIVTGRRKHTACIAADRVPFTPDQTDIVDADLTDLWMFTHRPTVGDLSAKGKARKLHNSRFVLS